MKLKPSKSVIRCVYCGSEHVYEAGLTLRQKIVRVVSPGNPYRCGACSRRFTAGPPYFSSLQFFFHLGLAALGVFLILANMDRLHEGADRSATPGGSRRPRFAVTYPPAESKSPQPGDTSSGGGITPDQPDKPAEKSSPEGKAEVEAGSAVSSQASRDVELPGKQTYALVPKENEAPARGSLPQGERLHAAPAATLAAVECLDTNGQIRVELTTKGGPVEYSSFSLGSPPRVVVDLLGKWNYSGPLNMEVKNRLIHRVRLGRYENKLRVVMDLKRPRVSRAISKTDVGIAVVLE